MQINQRIKLDTVRQNHLSIPAKQEDLGSRFLLITLLMNGMPLLVEQESTVCLNAIKPDGHRTATAGTVQEDGTVLVELTNQTLAVEGTVICDLTVTDAQGRRLSSVLFYVEVERTASDENVLISTDEFSVLTDTMSRVSLFVQQAEEATQTAHQATNAATDAANRAEFAANTAYQVAEDAVHPPVVPYVGLSVMGEARVYLVANTVGVLSIRASCSFELPETVPDCLSQILIRATVQQDASIQWGTSRFFGEMVPDVVAGNYNFYFESMGDGWVAGAVKVG